MLRQRTAGVGCTLRIEPRLRRLAGHVIRSGPTRSESHWSSIRLTGWSAGSSHAQRANAPRGRARIPGISIFGLNIFAGATTQFDPNLAGPVDANYRLGPGDRIVLIITGDAERAFTLDVTREGFVVIQGIGEIPAANLTLGQFEDQLYAKLGRVYSGLKRGAGATTHFSLNVARLHSNQVYVLGDVDQPGSYRISSAGTALTALYAAGGPTRNGGMRRVEIRRGGKLVDTPRSLRLFAPRRRLARPAAPVGRRGVRSGARRARSPLTARWFAQERTSFVAVSRSPTCSRPRAGSPPRRRDSACRSREFSRRTSATRPTDARVVIDVTSTQPNAGSHAGLSARAGRRGPRVSRERARRPARRGAGQRRDSRRSRVHARYASVGCAASRRRHQAGRVSRQVLVSRLRGSGFIAGAASRRAPRQHGQARRRHSRCARTTKFVSSRCPSSALPSTWRSPAPCVARGGTPIVKASRCETSCCSPAVWTIALPSREAEIARLPRSRDGGRLAVSERVVARLELYARRPPTERRRGRRTGWSDARRFSRAL